MELNNNSVKAAKFAFVNILINFVTKKTFCYIGVIILTLTFILLADISTIVEGIKFK